MSAAVVVNYKKSGQQRRKQVCAMTQQDFGQINNLVREAMGYNPAVVIR